LRSIGRDGPVQETPRSSHEPGTPKSYVKVEHTEGRRELRRKREERRNSDGSILPHERWEREVRRGYVRSGNQIIAYNAVLDPNLRHQGDTVYSPDDRNRRLSHEDLLSIIVVYALGEHPAAHWQANPS